MKPQLLKVRKAVKTLRKGPYKRMFKVSQRKLPKLDCVTRWNSTFLMIERLLAEKEFICSLTEGDKEKVIDDGLWEFIAHFCAAYSPVAEATIKLQGSQITFGDFFLIWEKCTYELKNSNNNLSLIVAQKMDERRRKLMDKPLFLAAIYLDQRINFRNSPFISKDEREIAVVGICDTMHRK